MKLSEFLFALAMIVFFLLPSALFRQWRLFFAFLAFFIVLGLMEWLSVIQTGSSISQLFWSFDSANPVGGWVIVGGLALGWVAFLAHLKIHKKK